MISLPDSFATAVPIGNSLSASPRGGVVHAFARGLVVFGTGADYTDCKVRGKRRAVVC